MGKGLLLYREVVYTSQLTAVSKSPRRYPENWTSCYLEYVIISHISHISHIYYQTYKIYLLGNS